MLLRKWVFLSIDLLWIEASFHLETITDTVHESQQKAAWEEKGMWNTMMSSEGMKLLKKSPLVKTVWSSEFSFFCPDCQEKCSRSSLTTNIWILSQHGSDFYSVTSNSDQTVQNGHKLNPSQPSGCQTSPEEGKVTESSGNIAPFKPVDERTWSTGSFSK